MISWERMAEIYAASTSESTVPSHYIKELIDEIDRLRNEVEILTATDFRQGSWHVFNHVQKENQALRACLENVLEFVPPCKCSRTDEVCPLCDAEKTMEALARPRGGGEKA